MQAAAGRVEGRVAQLVSWLDIKFSALRIILASTVGLDVLKAVVDVYVHAFEVCNRMHFKSVYVYVYAYAYVCMSIFMHFYVFTVVYVCSCVRLFI